MSTDIYGDETTLPTETSFTLGNRGDDLGVWVTTTVSDDRVFIPLREIRDIKIALESIKIAVAALRNIGIGLSAIPNLLPKHLDGVGQELDGAGELCDSLIGLVRLDEPSPFDRLLGGALGTTDSFVDTHDSSPSVGSPVSVRGQQAGNPNPTEGETSTGLGAATIHNTKEASGSWSAEGFETSERDI